MHLSTYPVGHIALRVSNIQISRHFYIDTLGFDLLVEMEESIIMNGHGVPIALLSHHSMGSQQRFDPFQIGLDHLALHVIEFSELNTLQQRLDAAHVPNHGIEQDPMTGATYISFYDPDGIAWELYVLPTPS